MTDDPTRGAEQIVLGALILDPTTIEKVQPLLTGGQFYHPRHAAIYHHILAAHAAGEPVEPVALARRIDGAGDLDRVGGAPYLHELIAAVPLAANVTYYVEIVVDSAERRAVAEQAARLGQAAGISDPDRRRQVVAEVAGRLTGTRESAEHATPLQRLRAALLDSAGLDSIPDPEPLIGDDILFRDTLNWMVGKPGHGKSFVALDMAGCVGTGQAWQTYPVTEGTVLYLVAEGARGTKKRVRAWERAMDRDMHGVHFLPLPVQSTNAKEWDALVELARELDAAMIVLDTQARVTVGVEENSNTEMGRFVHQAERLREASHACVVIVHHIGRNGETGRGATVLDGALSTIIKVSKDENRIKLECTKNKDAEEWDDIELRAVPIGEGKERSIVLMPDDGLRKGGDGTTSPAALRTARAWWENHTDTWVGKSDLVDVVAPKSTLFRHLTELRSAGLVQQDSSGKYPRYRMTYSPDGFS